jgi:hypothetical protein
MNVEIETIKTDCNYLSEVLDTLPSHVLLNKGITGCGGTHLELLAKRNSVILVPTVELAKNKQKQDYLLVYGKVSANDILRYVSSDLPYKKIIGTYDSLKKMLHIVPSDYFLLIDEYHILFNAYSFRNEAILFLLRNYQAFQNFCFMTATPLDEDIVLDEIKHLKRLNIVWEKSVPIKLNLVDTSFTNKELMKLFTLNEDCNYHIFLNSVRTIKDIVNKSKITDYKVVCSETARANITALNTGSTLDPVCRYNFYTATAFEGCDIFDEKGKTIILCDTNIATTILDIATLVRQICGRLRNSYYKEEITLILNTNKHRYAGTSSDVFQANVKENVKLGQYTEHKFNTDPDPEYKQKELRSYSEETYHSFYVNKYDNQIFYDDNLRKMDEYNYKLITETFESTISVLKEMKNNNFIPKTIEKRNWITEKLSNREYSYKELEELFKLEFLERGIDFNGYKIKDHFPPFTKKIKTKNKIKETYYKFTL